jgi:peptidoglycan/LPS O-acetylase OafA/YrhL
MGRDKRILALDGLRGCLAVVVVAAHYDELFHTNALFLLGQLAVVIFFLMSGYVLTRSWDGNYFPFWRGDFSGFGPPTRPALQLVM